MFILEQRRCHMRANLLWIFVLKLRPELNIFLTTQRFTLLLCRILLPFWGEMTEETMINLLEDAHASDGAALSTGRNIVWNL